MKERVRYLYYRNPLVRSGVNLFARMIRPEARPPCGHLVTYREEDVSGPLQREEALFFLGLVKVIRPQTVVEFGFHYGHSAFNFLQALDPESRLYSYDIADTSAEIARRCFGGWRNFRFLRKSQDAFSPSDIDGRKIDLVFIDAAHIIEINQRTFTAILPALAPNALVCVHDTGTWPKSRMGPVQQEFAEGRPEDWISADEFQHIRHEREFVNWIVREHPFHAVHLHSLRCIRNGITLLQRNTPLVTRAA
jgi:predicted O-methyltransferase YrrM